MDNGIERFVPLIDKPLFIEVGNICERQKNQSGHFLIFPNKVISKHTIDDQLVEMDDQNPVIRKKLIIDRKMKKDILLQLKKFGISEDALFSDDIDRVLKYVVKEQKKRYPEARD